MSKKLTKNEIEKIIKDLEYILLDLYRKDNFWQVIVQDKNGYKFDSNIYGLLKKGFSIVHKTNPFSLENISLWLKLNNKNFELSNENVYTGSDKKLGFYCFKCEDIFLCTWDDILSGRKCGLCDGRQVGKYNNLKYLLPDLAEEWSNKNKILSSEVTIGYDKDVIWKCSKCGKEWSASPNRRTCPHGSGCPFCSGNLVSDKNRLTIRYPDLIKEWNYNKNKDILPENYSFGSNKKVWWICSVGHEWIARINQRTSKNAKCPICSGKTVTDKNRLSVCYPDIAKEWNFKKNKTLTPENISYGSHIKVWWKCGKCKFEWFATPHSRTSKMRTGCPRCSASKGEKFIISLLQTWKIINIHQKSFDDCIDKEKLLFDFYLSEKNICIEFHGRQHYEIVDFAGKGDLWANKEFNKNKKHDKIKFDYCKRNKIKLIIIPYWKYDEIEEILQKTLL
jgi:hypothetical protein